MTPDGHIRFSCCFCTWTTFNNPLRCHYIIMVMGFSSLMFIVVTCILAMDLVHCTVMCSALQCVWWHAGSVICRATVHVCHSMLSQQSVGEAQHRTQIQ